MTDPVTLAPPRASAPMGRLPALLLAGLVCGALWPQAVPGATWRVPGPGLPDVGSALRRAAAGDEIVLAPGVYRETLTITRSVTLSAADPADPPVLDGGGRGTVVRIQAPGARLRGLSIRNSGDDVEERDACVYVHEPAAAVELTGNTLGECLFGVWVNGAPGARIVGNRVSGLYKPIASDRGNGLNLWRVRNALVRHNVIHDVRDGIYISVSTASRIEENLMYGLRFGVHYMYNDNNRITGNATCASTVGLAMMFSKHLEIDGNLAIGNRDHGMLFRSIYSSRIHDNTVVANGKGFFVNDTADNEITANLVMGNAIGVHITAGSQGDRVHGNVFADNPRQVRFTQRRDILWDAEGRGNYWSDYLGWDLNHDGRGDRTYRASDRVDALVHRYPQVKLLAHSPALQMLQALEARFPVLRPPSLVDRHPLMRPPPVSPQAPAVTRFPEWDAACAAADIIPEVTD